MQAISRYVLSIVAVSMLSACGNQVEFDTLPAASQKPIAIGIPNPNDPDAPSQPQPEEPPEEREQPEQPTPEPPEEQPQEPTPEPPEEQPEEPTPEPPEEQPEEPTPEQPEDPGTEPPAGSLPESESFEQVATAKKIDIVMVIDNSDSMYFDHYKKRLQAKFRGFLATLQGVDYRLAVTTTDMQTNTDYRGWGGTLADLDGNGRLYITPSTANKEELFLNAVHRPEAMDCRHQRGDRPCGTNYEEPIRALMSVVDQKGTANFGFFRGDADLVAVMVSDENEHSDGGPEATEPSVAVQYVEGAFGGQKNLSVYGVVIPPGDKQCHKEQKWQEWITAGAEYGTYVDELARLTGGTTTSICEKNYSQSLSVIGQRARNGGALFKSVTLQYEPIEGTVEVNLTPATRIDYRVEGLEVIFDREPPVGTRIDVNYERSI